MWKTVISFPSAEAGPERRKHAVTDAINFEEEKGSCSIVLDGLKSSSIHFSTTKLVTGSLSATLWIQYQYNSTSINNSVTLGQNFYAVKSVWS